MKGINTFSVVGICYNSPKFFNKNGDMCASIILVVQNNNKKVFIPIIAFKDNADILIRLGRNGNLVAISGYIDTTEYFDKMSGVSSIRVFFVMEDMMVISKMKPTRLTEKRIEDLVKTFNLE